jgi:hypothetical protein
LVITRTAHYGKKSLIQREKKQQQKLEQKYHLIRRSSKKIRSKVSPLSLSEKTKMHEKLQSWFSGIDDPRRALFTILYKWTILFV